MKKVTSSSSLTKAVTKTTEIPKKKTGEKEMIQPQKNHGIDTYSYRGWLNSDSFIKRSLACLGYQAMGTLIIYGCILVVVLIIGIIFLIGSKLITI